MKSLKKKKKKKKKKKNSLIMRCEGFDDGPINMDASKARGALCAHTSVNYRSDS